MPHTLLIVDDEKHTREGLERVFEDDYDVYLAADAEEAFRLLESEAFDVVLTDLRMAGKSGMSVIDKALKLPHRPVCIMMTAYGNVETAVDAMKRGAYDFLTKPINIEKLEIIIKRALRSDQLAQENKQLHKRLDEKYQVSGIVGQSQRLVHVMEEVQQVAPSKATVLITGETGTGKEMVAQMIHQNSPRAHNNFVPVHCAALPANLLESELFGHEKGAFTGATDKRIGRFESADGGTLFLDEIGEIEPSVQIKLLRFLEEKTFERVGGTKPIKVDVRLVCATNRDLSAMVKEGTFREDLYYRLNVVNVHMPALRDRAGDVPVLMEHYIKHFAVENGFKPVRLSAAAMKALRVYTWPGNIRELRNLCESLVVMHRGGEITEHDLDPKFLGHEPHEHIHKPSHSSSKPLSFEESEQRLIRDALKKTKGNRTKAADLLKISRRTLHRKLQQWPELDVR